MAVTRKSTGSSRPRILDPISTSPSIVRKPKTKSANKKKVTIGKEGVTKPGKPIGKKKSTLTEKVKVAAKKIEEKLPKAKAPKTKKPAEPIVEA